MDKIKVLHIITHLELGGAQKNAISILKSLDKNIYSAYFVSSNKGLLLEDVKKVDGIKLNLLSSLRRQINPFFDLLALFQLYKLIKNIGFDIVHTHSPKAGILGRWAAHLAGVRVIIHTIHGWEFHEYQFKLAYTTYRVLERITAKITDCLIAVSKFDMDKGIKHKIGSREKYRLIRYNIDTQYSESYNNKINFDVRKGLRLPGGCLLVGMIACLKPQKSPLDFVRLAYILSKSFVNVRFLLVGDGALRDRASSLAAKLKIEDKLFCLGWRRDASEIIKSLDVLVLTSLWEGLPLVFLEAMALKKPIVATDICGNGEVIKNDINGFLVPPGDIEAMADRVGYLLKDKDLAGKMGQAGYNIFSENFKESSMQIAINTLYKDLRRRN